MGSGGGSKFNDSRILFVTDCDRNESRANLESKILFPLLRLSGFWCRLTMACGTILRGTLYPFGMM